MAHNSVTSSSTSVKIHKKENIFFFDSAVPSIDGQPFSTSPTQSDVKIFPKCTFHFRRHFPLVVNEAWVECFPRRVWWPRWRGTDLPLFLSPPTRRLHQACPRSHRQFLKEEISIYLCMRSLSSLCSEAWVHDGRICLCITRGVWGASWEERRCESGQRSALHSIATSALSAGPITTLPSAHNGLTGMFRKPPQVSKLSIPSLYLFIKL